MEMGNGKRGKWEIQPLKIIYVSYIDHSFWLLTPRHSVGAGERVRGCAGDNLLTREPRLAFNICLVMSRRLPLIVGVAWHGNLWNCIVVLGSLCGCNLIKRLPQTEAPPEGRSGRPAESRPIDTVTPTRAASSGRSWTASGNGMRESESSRRILHVYITHLFFEAHYTLQ